MMCSMTLCVWICILSCAHLKLNPGPNEFDFVLNNNTGIVFKPIDHLLVRRTYYLICHNFSHEFSNRMSDDQCQKLILEDIGRLRDGLCRSRLLGRTYCGHQSYHNKTNTKITAHSPLAEYGNQIDLYVM